MSMPNGIWAMLFALAFDVGSRRKACDAGYKDGYTKAKME